MLSCRHARYARTPFCIFRTACICRSFKPSTSMDTCGGGRFSGVCVCVCVCARVHTLRSASFVRHAERTAFTNACSKTSQRNQSWMRPAAYAGFLASTRACVYVCACAGCTMKGGVVLFSGFLNMYRFVRWLIPPSHSCIVRPPSSSGGSSSTTPGSASHSRTVSPSSSLRTLP